MNNLLSYCGLVDVRINASDKDLPVHKGPFSRFLTPTPSHPQSRAIFDPSPLLIADVVYGRPQGRKLQIIAINF